MRALCQEDQSHFAELFEQARNYVDAGYQNEMATIESFLVSVVLTQEKRIAELEGRILEFEKLVIDDHVPSSM